MRAHRRAKHVLLLTGGLLLGLGAVWLVVTGLVARSQLSHLESRLRQVRTLVAAGHIQSARTAAADIPAMARRAQHLTTGPAWWMAAHVPYFGDPIDVIRATTAATAEVGAEAVPTLLQVAADIEPSRLRSGRTVALAPLVGAAPKLAAAGRVLDRSVRELRGLPSGTWFGAVDDGRARLATELRTMRGYVDAAARACRVLPTLLGQSRPQRYFIGLQNEAELRGTGGLPGAFAIAVADHGTITFTQFASDRVLLRAGTNQQITTGLDFGRAYDNLYGASQPTTSYVDSNVSPNFPYAAQVWAAMWQRVSGERVDGAIALDPSVLAYFLDVTGPARLSGGGIVTAANVVPLVEKTNYALYPDNTRRKAFLVSVLQAAATKLVDGSGQPLRLVQYASHAAKEQRLLVWSRDPAVEGALAQTNYGGAIPAADPRPFSGVILNNAAAGKLDYYLGRSVSYSRTGCGARRDVAVTIKLTNDAPASGLPSYVTTRLDAHPPANAKPGDNRTLLDYYATNGALLQSVTLNGKPATASVAAELGHAVFRLDLELPRGTTQTVVLHLNEPAGKGAPLFWRQPGVTPISIRALDPSCRAG